jgi:nitrous oxidase accessory protein NosD
LVILERAGDLKRIASSYIIALLFLSLFVFAFTAKPVRAESVGTIIINPDGRITPSTANITTTDNVTYTFTGSNYLPIVVQRDNVIIDGKGWTLHGAGNRTGMDLSNRTKTTVKNTQITNFGIGILLNFSSDINLSGNNITNDSVAGICSDHSGDLFSWDTISGNNITNDGCGISFNMSGDTAMFGNKIVGNTNAGIQVNGGYDFATISGNLIMNNTDGIWVHLGSHCSISWNNITENRNAGINLDCNYLIISGNNITANGNYGIYGMFIGGVYAEAYDTNAVSGNCIKSNTYGICSGYLYSTTITGNSIANNSYGMSFYLEAFNKIIGNNITNNSVGIEVHAEDQSNAFYDNNVTTNGVGIDLYTYSNTFTDDVIFYNNDFINNSKQAVDWGPNPIAWDNGYPTGGNYWSDYNGTDQKRGSNQNISGSDGIGDTPYIIDAKNKDNYPFMKPSGWVGTEAVPEFQTFMLLPLFMIITLLGAIVLERKRNVKKQSVRTIDFILH